MEIQLAVFVPNAAFFKLKIVGRCAADSYRKTAGDPLSARLLSGKDVKLDH